MPIMENMKIKSKSSKPREAMDGAAERSVLKISWSFSAFLISLKTLPILNVLRMVPRISRSFPTPAHAMPKITSVATTIVKSKRFQLSVK